MPDRASVAPNGGILSCNDNCPMRTECRVEFNHINQRLNDGNEMFGDHADRLRESELQVMRLSEALKNQTESMIKLTRAVENQSKTLVSVALMFMGSLFGFFLWFVQNG